MKNFFMKYGLKLIAIVTLIYIAIYLVFCVNGVLPLGSDLTKGDWLGFWAGFLSFVGALFLGVIAIWQNNMLDQKNSKLEQNNFELSQKSLDFQRMQLVSSNKTDIKQVYANNLIDNSLDGSTDDKILIERTDNFLKLPNQNAEIGDIFTFLEFNVGLEISNDIYFTKYIIHTCKIYYNFTNEVLFITDDGFIECPNDAVSKDDQLWGYVENQSFVTMNDIKRSVHVTSQNICEMSVYLIWDKSAVGCSMEYDELYTSLYESEKIRIEMEVSLVNSLNITHKGTIFIECDNLHGDSLQDGFIANNAYFKIDEYSIS